MHAVGQHEETSTPAEVHSTSNSVCMSLTAAPLTREGTVAGKYSQKRAILKNAVASPCIHGVTARDTRLRFNMVREERLPGKR